MITYLFNIYITYKKIKSIVGAADDVLWAINNIRGMAIIKRYF